MEDTRTAWCVVKSKPCREEQVADNLRAKDVLVYVPKARTPKANASRKKLPYTKPRCLFPGYVFVHLSPRDCHLKVRWVPGVRAILGFHNRVAVVDEEGIQELRSRENDSGYIDLPAHRFHNGETVEICGGTFQGWEALFVQYLSHEERVQVLLDFLNAERRVDMPLDDIRPLRQEI